MALKDSLGRSLWTVSDYRFVIVVYNQEFYLFLLLSAFTAPSEFESDIKEAGKGTFQI